MKIAKKIIGMALCAIVGLLILFYGYMHFVYYGDDWKQRTTPLPLKTITVLCENFKLEKNPLCTGKKVVYAPDFYGIIRDAFRPFEAYGIASSEAATYDEVEKKIGVFRYECEDVIQESDGFTYFRCDYDLRGDGEFIIDIMYTYPDNAVFRINTPMGYDGE